MHHALRARFCIERGRVWQAEYWLSGVRDYALHLACLCHDLPARNGRGFDDLPADTLVAFDGALARSLAPAELLRALEVAITGLLREARQVSEIADMAAQVEPHSANSLTHGRASRNAIRMRLTFCLLWVKARRYTMARMCHRFRSKRPLQPR